MKLFKRGMALLLTALVLVSSLPAMAEGPSVSGENAGGQSLSGNEVEETSSETAEETKSSLEAEKKQNNAEDNAESAENVGGEKETDTLSGNQIDQTGSDDAVEEILFNTGNHAWSVVSQEDFENGAGDVYFADDGSYTINIPEENPFFPYEVQFTCDGEVTNEWFMTPEDSVEIGGHTFYVSAAFDDTAVTQMSLNIGGDIIVVYPEEKEFTDGGLGIAPASLLPLEEVTLGTIDLTGYTPLELTMVGVDYIFGNSLSDGDKVVWTYQSEDNYTISEKGDTIDLSRDTYSGGIKYWEMIVGSGDQLDSGNVRYTVPVQVTASENWLEASVYGGDREFTLIENSYHDDGSGEKYLTLKISEGQWNREMTAGVKLKINAEVFPSTNINYVEVYSTDGYYDLDKIKELEITNIADVMWNVADDDKRGAGFWKSSESLPRNWITLVAYSQNNEMIGFLRFSVNWDADSDGFDIVINEKNGNNYTKIGESTVWRIADYYNYPCKSSTSIEMPKGYKENGPYYVQIKPNDASTIKETDVSAVYISQWTQINGEIIYLEDGQKDIKEDILGDGYKVDFPKEGWFSLLVLVGEDGSEEQKRYEYSISTYEKTDETFLSSLCNLSFSGLSDQDGNSINSFITEESDDSYGENNYVTMLVNSSVDLTSLAPEFSASTGAKVYTAGTSREEISGVSLHDFSDGPIQYTVLAEDGQTSRNYWLQIKQAVDGSQLYINSFDDKDANTREENGIIYSTREVMLDGYHDYIHDIWLANIGTVAIPRLSVMLDSDVVELDPYWTLTGNQDLAGFTTTETDKVHGQLSNIAKIRLRAKEGLLDGTDVAGTLTIRSGENTLAVLTLTGTIGDPCITTSEIPAAVKYVPYGTMIQNSNKYDWIQPEYSLSSGILPDGMEIKSNGELYGVPLETGSFWFSVKAVFEGRGQIYSSVMSYTLEVEENTNANVYLESDPGYSVLIPIGTETTLGSYDFYLSEIEDTLFVSEGLFEGFTDLWLNGQRLERGVDYIGESGSTRITIRRQTFENKADWTGTNTIAAEFRVDGDINKELKRTAQNFRLNSQYIPPVTEEDVGEENSGGNGNTNHDDGGEKGVHLVGYVLDAANTIVEGITVELHSTPRSVVTDSEGFFRFLDVEFGQHTLYIKDQNANILASKSFELSRGETFSINGTVITAAPDSSVTLTVKMENGMLNISATSASVQEGVQLIATAARTGDGEEPGRFLAVAVVSGLAVVFLLLRKKKVAGEIR